MTKLHAYWAKRGVDLDKLPVLRTSERGQFRKCKEAWWWGYRQGLTPKGPEHFNFWFGSGVHEALAEWYKPGLKRGRHPAETWQEYADGEMVKMRTIADEGELGVYVDAIELGTAMLENYVDTYGKDRHMYIIATEQTRKVLVFDEGVPIAWYFYTMDGIYRDRDDHNLIKLLEHKTAAIIDGSHLSLDDQAGAYVAFETLNLREEGLIKPDEAIVEVTYNYLRKETKKVDDRPVDEKGRRLNKDGSVSKQQRIQAPVLERIPISRSAEARAQQHDRIVLELRDMQFYRENPDQIYKSPTPGPFGCKGCLFKQMCELHEEGGDWEDYRDWKFNVRDPYGPYRKAA